MNTQPTSDLPENFEQTISGIDYRIEYLNDPIKPKTFVYHSQSGDLYTYFNGVLEALQIHEYVTKMRNEYHKGFKAGNISAKQEIRSKLGI